MNFAVFGKDFGVNRQKIFYFHNMIVFFKTI